MDESLAWNQIERRTNQSAPDAVPIPPTGAESFCQPPKKINHTKMKLQNTATKPNQFRVRRRLSPYFAIQRPGIRQRRDHQIEEPNRYKIIHTVSEIASGFRNAQMKQPGRDRSAAGKNSDD